MEGWLTRRRSECEEGKVVERLESKARKTSRGEGEVGETGCEGKKPDLVAGCARQLDGLQGGTLKG